MANVFLCSWLGLDIRAYRKIHWQHHLHLATPTDTENSYFNPLSFSFIAETLTGIHLVRVITNKSNKEFLGKELSKRAVLMLLIGVVIHLFLLAIAIYYNNLQFAITWILAMAIFFPFFATIRQVIEHRDEMATEHKDFYHSTRGRVSRIFSSGVFSYLFGAAGFNKHLIHHWDPHLPFTALTRAEKFLLRCKRTQDIVESSRTSYLTVFKKLLFPR